MILLFKLQTWDWKCCVQTDRICRLFIDIRYKEPKNIIIFLIVLVLINLDHHLHNYLSFRRSVTIYSLFIRFHSLFHRSIIKKQTIDLVIKTWKICWNNTKLKKETRKKRPGILYKTHTISRASTCFKAVHPSSLIGSLWRFSKASCHCRYTLTPLLPSTY